MTPSQIQNQILRVLCVEDNPGYAQDVRTALEEPQPELAEANRVTAFDVTFADHGAQGEFLLRQAMEQHHPFDVVLLDLGLPERPDEKPERITGLRLLRLALNELSNPGTAVIVQSAFTEFESVREVLTAGAIDFVGKPFTPTEMFVSVASALHRVRRASAVEWLNLQRHKRQQWILSQACVQTADQILESIQGELTTVFDQSNTLAHSIEDQFGMSLEYDAGEPVCRDMLGLQQRVTGMSDAVAKKRPFQTSPDTQPELVDLKQLLTANMKRLESGVVTKRLRWAVDSIPALQFYSYRNELDAILFELLFNTVEASPEAATVFVSLEMSDDAAKLIVRDQAEAIPSLSIWTPFPLPDESSDTSDASAIGESQQERAWVLGLVSQAAHSILGQLQVQATDSGNELTFLVRGIDHG